MTNMLKFLQEYTAKGYIVNIYTDPTNKYGVEGMTIAITNPANGKTGEIFTPYVYLEDDRWGDKKKALFEGIIGRIEDD